MSKTQSTRPSGFVRTVRKFFVSGFVVFTFVAYALHERLANPGGTASAIAPAQGPFATQQAPAAPQLMPTAAQIALATPQAVAPATATAPPTAAPPATSQALPTPATVTGGQYKDGEYT